MHAAAPSTRRVPAVSTYVRRNSMHLGKYLSQRRLQLRFAMLAALLNLPRLSNTGGILHSHNQRAQVLKLLLLVHGNQSVIVINILWYL
jgi:hypothetical protein